MYIYFYEKMEKFNFSQTTYREGKTTACLNQEEEWFSFKFFDN